MSVKDNRHRYSVTFTEEEARQLENIAKRENKSISKVIHEKTMDSLVTCVNAENIDMITHIIRTQLKDILQPNVERLAALSSKTCIQAATAAFLNAETINKFVPISEQKNFMEVYEAARKKGIEYTRNKNYMNDDEV